MYMTDFLSSAGTISFRLICTIQNHSDIKDVRREPFNTKGGNIDKTNPED